MLLHSTRVKTVMGNVSAGTIRLEMFAAYRRIVATPKQIFL